MRGRVVAACGVVLLAVTGCTGVPTSSSPQTIQPLVATAPSNPPSSGPEPGADPDSIVDDFLEANAVDAGTHASARAYLTRSAASHWQDNNATIISDRSNSTYDARTHTVTFYARLVGTVDPDGIYTPSLQGAGDGGARQPFKFTLEETDGQFRIAQLPHNGLLLTDAQFASTYAQRVLYFYDLSGRYLIQDPRWSALTDRTQLADWLLGELAHPLQSLASAVSTDTLPTQVSNARNMTVTLGNPNKVEIPGSSQLDPDVRARLAAQISETLAAPLSQLPITITDNGTPVTIPGVAGGTQFSVSDFDTVLGPPAPDPEVYYLSGGRVLTESGKPLAGPLGNGSTFLNSVAVHRDGGSLVVAGVSGSGASARLLVGNQGAGVRPTSLRGQLTRPAFAPGLDEVWIGAGPKLYRATISGTSAQLAQVTIPGVAGGGQILSVRVSPEGSRVALVVAGAAGTAQLYVGAIVRGSGQVRIDDLILISPAGVSVTDVTWLERDPLQLTGIGKVGGSTDTFKVGVDGSAWRNYSTGNLPGLPDTVTVAPGQDVWVSANNLVWEQVTPTQWESPVAHGQTPGEAPIYLQ